MVFTDVVTNSTEERCNARLTEPDEKEIHNDTTDIPVALEALSSVEPKVETTQPEKIETTNVDEMSPAEVSVDAVKHASPDVATKVDKEISSVATDSTTAEIGEVVASR